MPTRVSAAHIANGNGTDATGGDYYALQSRPFTSSRIEETSLLGMHGLCFHGTCMAKLSLTQIIAEARTSKRFQRSTPDGELALPRQDPAPSTKSITESSVRRRQLPREQKAPQGLGSVQNSPSKRYVYRRYGFFL